MAENTGATSSVFISYSRRNIEMAQKLNDSLDNSGVDAWVDWEGIPLSSDWMDEITRAIEGADAFLFIITPDSLASEVCAQELELGLKYNKKLIPVLYKEPEKGSTMHEALAATNWVYMREQDNYEATLPGLLESIHTDLDWVRQHTRLLQRAKEWEDKGHGNSFLLQGDDLNDAESWMVDAADQEGREVVPLQGEYIQASRQLATKRQRNLLIGVSLALVVSIGAAIYAMVQRGVAIEKEHARATEQVRAEQNEAEAVANEHARATQQVIAEEQKVIAQENEAQAIQNEITAKAQRAAAEARIYQTQAGELDTSTLLAVDSWQRSPSFLAEDILRRNTSLSPFPIAQVAQGDRIWRIKRSPDSKYFATASEDSTVCLWAMEDATQQFCVEHENPVYDIVFSLDGEMIISAGKGGTLRLWSAKDGSPIKSYDFNGTTLWDIDIRPDGTQVAVARQDGFISLIDLEDLEADPVDREHGSPVYKVVYSPDNEWLGVGMSSGETLFWNIDQVYYVYGAKHDDEVYALDFSPNGDWIVSGGADSKARLNVVDENGNDYAVMAHGDWIEFIEFGPDNDWFATASDDNNLRIWDVETGTERLRMEHDGFVLRMDISSNGAWITSTGYDKTARVWDTVSGSEMMQIPLDVRGTAILFNEDGTKLIVGDAVGGITLWDTSRLLSRLNIFEFPELVREARYSPSGEWLAVNTDKRDVWLLAIEKTLEIKDATAEGEAIFKTEGISYDLGFSPNSRWIAAAVSRGDQVVLYDLETQTSSLLTHEDETNAFDFSPDNTKIAIAGANGILRFWDLESATEVGMIENTNTPTELLAVAYHPDGTQIATSLENKIVIWDVESQKENKILYQSGRIYNVEYSKDGAWLATASNEGTVYLWDVQNDYARSSNILRLSGEPYSLEFSPDNRLLAGGSTNYFAYVWDVELGQEVARLPHSDVVRSVDFSPDGLELATVARKTVQIWDIPALPSLPRDNLVNEVCSYLVSNLSESEWDVIYPGEEYRMLCPDLEAKK